VATLPAHLVATPVLERLTGEGRGTVLGAGATAAWVDLNGFVVAVTTREVPLLPNAIALAAGSGALAGATAGSGGAARLGPGRVTLGHLQITWDPAAPPSWDPTVPVPTGVTRRAVGARGAAILRTLRAGTGAVDSHLNRVPRSARELVRELARVGLVIAGDPEGAVGLTWLFRAVGEGDPEPAGERAWPAALRRLERLGHGSGRAYAAGIAATASLLAVGAPARR
jgi:hypothetical protein